MADKNVKKIGKKMPKSEAKKWVKRYQKENPKETHGWLFGDDIIKAILKYKGCEGIWFFKGVDDQNEEKLLMFPADEDGNILEDKKHSMSVMEKSMDENDEPADFSQPCPPKCPSGL
ncbi:hypothetical protein [Ekhidna sp.]|uniref:hypothetical protein n=1 Tax=Ekhidna sp. TaxID=2608089 RepID=UPI003CCC3852